MGLTALDQQRPASSAASSAGDAPPELLDGTRPPQISGASSSPAAALPSGGGAAAAEGAGGAAAAGSPAKRTRLQEAALAVRHEAAITLQAHTRGKACRVALVYKRFEADLEYDAASYMQALWRGHLTRGGATTPAAAPPLPAA